MLDALTKLVIINEWKSFINAKITLKLGYIRARII